MGITLQYGGENKEMALWGITSCVINRTSFAADTAVLTVAEDFDVPGLFAFEAPVVIAVEGVVKLRGVITEIPKQGSGQGESHSYTVSGPWYWLENLAYQQAYKVYIDPAQPELGLEDKLLTRQFLNAKVFTKTGPGASGYDSFQIGVGQQIADALNFVRDRSIVEHGVAAFNFTSYQTPVEMLPLSYVPGTLPSVFSGNDLYPPVNEVSERTVAEVLHQELRWMPDLVAYFDYGQNPPRLFLTRYQSMPEVSLSLVNGEQTATFDVKPRYDLLVPLVYLTFIITGEVDGQKYERTIEQYYPSTYKGNPVTGREFRALRLTLNLAGAGGSNTKATIVTISTGDGINNWKSRLGTLADNVRVNVTGLDPIDGVPRNSNGTLKYPYELKEGQIADWMGGQHENVVLKARISYELFQDNGSLIGTVTNELLTYPVTMTTLKSGDYRQLNDRNLGDPFPLDLAQKLYASRSILHYDGSIQVSEEEVSGLVYLGLRLNLTGGDAAWATMKAVIQSITEDVLNGATTIAFGTPKQLGAQEYLDIIRVARDRVFYTGAQAMSNPGGGLSDVELGRYADGGRVDRVSFPSINIPVWL